MSVNGRVYEQSITKVPSLPAGAASHPPGAQPAKRQFLVGFRLSALNLTEGEHESSQASEKSGNRDWKLWSHLSDSAAFKL